MGRTNKIIIQLDGNEWCAKRKGFTNLQESLTGFGRTELEALNDLRTEEITKDNIEGWTDNQNMINFYKNQIG